MMSAMGALADLWKSERGLLCGLALICVTVMFALGRITSTEWLDAVKWILGVYVAGKSATSGVETVMLARARARFRDKGAKSSND